MRRSDVIKEFANSPREVHALAAGASFGALTTFFWLEYNKTVGLLFGLVFISVVTGVRFYSLVGSSSDKSAKDFVYKPTTLIRQLRKEGHYTMTSFTVTIVIVYPLVALL